MNKGKKSREKYFSTLSNFHTNQQCKNPNAKQWLMLHIFPYDIAD